MGDADGELAERLRAAAERLIEHAQAASWRGIDPHDGMYWSWPTAFAATPLRRTVLAQLHVRSPVDIRAWRRGPRPRISKTLALFAKAGLLTRRGDLTSSSSLAGAEAAQLLASDRAAGEKAWGYPFPVQTRWSSYPADSPNIVATSFAIDALLLAAAELGDDGLRERAIGAAEWIHERLLTPGGHFAYHEHGTALIHNASLLGAESVAAAVGATDAVRRAVQISLDAQRPDGSWPYGSGPRLGFADSFHTGYLLRSLIALRPLEPRIEAAVRSGADYWARAFFDDRGRALMWPSRAYPEDGHSAGTALSTLALLSDVEEEYLPLLRRVAQRALEAMVVGGHAVHRRYRWGRTRVSYIRWCDGHMAVGLAAAAERLARSGD